VKQDTPAFDPVLQTLSGLADAQGGDDGPVPTAVPLHDTGTALLSSLAVLAAVYARGQDDEGQSVFLSLADTSMFLQFSEVVQYAGKPGNGRGGYDFRGPDPGHHYYECADGWVALAADGAGLSRLGAALGLAADSGLAKGLNSLTLAGALELCGRCGVPAGRVISSDAVLDDPFLVEQHFDHVVKDPEFGRVRVAHHYGDWGDVGRPAPVPPDRRRPRQRRDSHRSGRPRRAGGRAAPSHGVNRGSAQFTVTELTVLN
jgi:crotonobetainyl-CoA:carnitine CoA-transferase CaiB-like acyl-CoA transferase